MPTFALLSNVNSIAFFSKVLNMINRYRNRRIVNSKTQASRIGSCIKENEKKTLFQQDESFQGDLCTEVPERERRNVSWKTFKPDQLGDSAAKSRECAYFHLPLDQN